MADTKTVTNLPIKDFRSDVDDPAEWIPLFETTVKMCLPTEDENVTKENCKNWFPLKLDDKAKRKYSAITSDNWTVIKAEFIKALVDPQEEYNWHARRNTIVWDGVESFQDLAARVRKSVDKYEEPAARVREYFFRFHLALPIDYRKAIDIGLAKDKRKIDEAQNIADRIRLANAEAAEESGATAAPARAVTFNSMSEDRIKQLEMQVQGLSVQQESMVERQDKQEKRFSRGRERDRDSSDDRHDSRDRRSESRGRDRDDRRRRDDSRDRRGGRRDNGRYRAYNGDRSRRDSFDRRDYGRRYDDRRDTGQDYNRSRYDSRDGGQYDSRERGYNRDRRYDSRDRDHRYDNRDRDYDRWDNRDNRDNDRNGGDSRDRPLGDRQDNRNNGNLRARLDQRLANFDDTQLQWIYNALDVREQNQGN